MKARIDALLRIGRDRASLTTFHYYSEKEHGNTRSTASIASRRSAAVLAYASSQLGHWPSTAQPVEQFMPVIVRMLGECVAPENAMAWLGGYSNQSEAAAVFQEYRALSIATGQLGFDLLLALAVELLEAKPLVAEQVRRIYTHVCVDEFQDTNAAQYRLLIQLVMPKAPNLFVVADDDQLIFEWNGASAARLQDLKQLYRCLSSSFPRTSCPPQ